MDNAMIIIQDMPYMIQTVRAVLSIVVIWRRPFDPLYITEGYITKVGEFTIKLLYCK